MFDFEEALKKLPDSPGVISSTHLNINSVDVGNAILAMHSVRELGGVKDQLFAQKSFEKFYEI